MLVQYPIATKCVTCGSLNALSDLLAQYANFCKKTQGLGAKQTRFTAKWDSPLRQFYIGSLVRAPILQLWFAFVERLLKKWPPNAARTVVLKVP